MTCVLAWHYCSKALGVNIDRQIARTTPIQHQSLNSKPQKRHVIQEIVAPQFPFQKGPAPAEVNSDLSPEPEDDESGEKLVSISGQSALDNAHPPLVKVVSQNMIGQRLAPTIKVFSGRKLSHSVETPGGPRKFPSYSDYAALNEQAEALPDIIHIPLEDSVKDVVLEGWEDLWFSDAEWDTEKWSKLNETKIDFVYTCKTIEMNG